jgi:hypothetical protein
MVGAPGSLPARLRRTAFECSARRPASAGGIMEDAAESKRYLSVFQMSVASFQSLPTFCQTTTYFPTTCWLC